jgi:hypothetical protein
MRGYAPEEVLSGDAPKVSISLEGEWPLGGHSLMLSYIGLLQNAFCNRFLGVELFQ